MYCLLERLVEERKVDHGSRRLRYHDQPLTEQGRGGAGHDGLLGLGPLTLHLLVLDVVVVKVAYHVHTLLGREGYEAEASVSLSDLIHQHDGVLHTPYTDQQV